MSPSPRLCLLVLALLVASATSSLGSKDPELKKCKQQCKIRSQYDEKEAKRCIKQYCTQDQGRKRENPFEYEVCHQVCTRGSLTQDWKCESKCEKQQPQNDEGRSPYVFGHTHFFTGWKTQHGNLRILQKFTERSKLLRGIENFRVAVIDAQPHTFLLPNHWDADGLLFVANGKGTVSLVHQEGRESMNVKEGDIIRIKAGTTTYLINSDNNERLVLVELVRPVNTPGNFEAFYGAGGENPESFYRAFSNEILEAAFNTRSDKLERIFGQQKQGAIVKASEEQIRGMSAHGKSKGTSKHSLYEQRAAQSNQYGQLYEVDSNQFRQLRDLDVAISLANISRGAMTAPHYNSRATKIMTVVNGEGYFEMACPQEGGRANHHESQAGTGYEKIRSNLKTGTVVVVPAGHPFVAVASNNQNLQLLCFEINAYNNQKYTLAGKGNVMKQLEREAKELAFGVASREVDEVFNSQQEEFFFRGPRQGRTDA